jgi:perosamine synthetase
MEKMIRRVIPQYKEEWFHSLKGYIEQYDFAHHYVIEELENKLKAYVGRSYALAVNSGTNGIFMCLYLLKRSFNLTSKAQLEVIIPNWGYPGVANVCKALGLKCVPVDLREETFCMNPQELKSKITPNTIAIVTTGNNGIIGSDIEEIRDTAEKKGIFFFEDCAPSLLQKFKGKNAGTFGNASMFSFSPTKPVICGEGAMLVTDNDGLYQDLKKFRHMTYSSDDKNFKCFADEANEGSLNCSLSPFLAAYVIPQLDIDNLNDIITKRERVYDLYKERLNIFGEEEATNRYGTIMYMSDKASQISKKFNLYKIEHRYKYYPLYDDSMPVSKKIFNNLIDLPSNYFLTEEQINAVCTIIKGV